MEEPVLTPSPLVEALVAAYHQASEPVPSGVEKIRVSRTVSAAAYLIERIRMAIEFRDENSMRRSAIERFLKRHMVMNEAGENIAPKILRELVWAKYLHNNTVPQEKVIEVQGVIEKYLFWRQQLLAHAKRGEQSFYTSWIFEVASCEIEERLAMAITRDAFVNFMFQHMQTAVVVKDSDPVTEDVQVYLAVSRAFLKSDRPLLRYQLLKLLEPEFEKKGKEAVTEMAPRMTKTIRIIEQQIQNPIGAKLTRFMRRQMPPFLILKDVFDHHEGLVSLVTDEKRLKPAVWETCARRYTETGKRLRNLAVKSIIYIFLTKMVFALAVELPVDKAMHGEVAWIPLGVNTAFPPLLMAIVALTNAPPGEQNTQRIYGRIREIVVHTPAAADHKTRFAARERVLRPVLTFLFTLLYGITFIAVFGMIVYVLNLVHFTIASQFIFVFFLCVVGFFSYQVHNAASEYRYEEREGLFSPILDFLLLPILHVGQWLSSEVTAGVSHIFTFIFDIFFEIPLKSFLGVLEEWFSFIRKKKEELT